MKELQRMLKDIEMEVHLTRHLIGKDSLDDNVMDAMNKCLDMSFYLRIYGIVLMITARHPLV